MRRSVNPTVTNSADVTFERINASELFDDAPLFAVVGSPPDFRFEYANRAFKELVNREHVLGEVAETVLPSAFEEGFRELLKSTWETGETVVGTDVEITIFTRPGAKPIKRYLDFVYKPLKSADGRVHHILCYGADVTGASRYRPPSASSAQIKAAARNTPLNVDAKKRLEKLSKRELQVLRRLAAGGTSKSIARELGLSPRTVEMYRSRVNGKLGVSSTAAAITLAALGGIGNM